MNESAAVLRSLLLLERKRQREVIKKRGEEPFAYDSCFCTCCGMGQRLVKASTPIESNHYAPCHLNDALNALGRKTNASRMAARSMLGITEDDEWWGGKPEGLVNTP